MSYSVWRNHSNFAANSQKLLTLLNKLEQMRKTILTLVAICAATTAYATVLRVSNVSGSTAPYSTIQAAHDAASAGDTIMVDGSFTEYGETTIQKRLVLIGPGYFLTENAIIDEAAPAATAIFKIDTEAEGTVVTGFRIATGYSSGLDVSARKCIIRRNFITGSVQGGIRLLAGADNIIIHQNYFLQADINVWEESRSNVQITNNIFVQTLYKSIAQYNSAAYLLNSYIAYNSFLGSYEQNYEEFRYVRYSTIEHNILRKNSVQTSTNSYVDNYIGSLLDFNLQLTDKDVQTVELAVTNGQNYGAFAGDSPYVLSGVPAAPVIEDLVVPTSVEYGSKINVTVKVGIQR